MCVCVCIRVWPMNENDCSVVFPLPTSVALSLLFWDGITHQQRQTEQSRIEQSRAEAKERAAERVLVACRLCDVSPAFHPSVLSRFRAMMLPSPSPFQTRSHHDACL